MLPMKNKVILITGALTGIGRATALAFAREGAHLVVCGRRDDIGNALATELRTLGVEAEYIRADVRHEDDVRSLVDRTIKRFGQLDVAVNTAGTEGKPGLNRFVGSEDKKAALVSRVPVKRAGLP